MQMKTEPDPTIAARIPKEHYDALGRIAKELTEANAGRTVRRSDVIRLAVALYLRRPLTTASTSDETTNRA